MLSYHARANNDDTAELLARDVPKDDKWQLNTFEHDSVSLEVDDTMLASVRMFMNLGTEGGCLQAPVMTLLHC